GRVYHLFNWLHRVSLKFAKVGVVTNKQSMAAISCGVNTIDSVNELSDGPVPRRM
ncbi:MAG: hypothetical protein ACJAXU_002016, partial [Paracoccaceae bacterium]